MSRLLFHLWQTHEISSVRARCLLSLRAVGCPKLADFLTQMQDPASIADTRVAEAFFAEELMHTASARPLEIVSIFARAYVAHHE